MVVVHDFRIVLNGEAHGGKDFLQLALYQGDGVIGAFCLRYRQRDVVLLCGSHQRFLFSGLDLFDLRADFFLHLFFQQIDVLAHFFFLFAADVLQALQKLCNRTLFAEIGHP